MPAYSFCLEQRNHSNIFIMSMAWIQYKPYGKNYYMTDRLADTDT